MNSSPTSWRPALAAMLVLATTLVSAGCAAGAASSAPAPTASGSSAPTATSSRIPLATSRPASSQKASLEALLPSLTTCMKAQGMRLSASSTGKQVRQAFRALPLASQEHVFTVCEHLLPASARQAIANDLAAEKRVAS
jgi:hypothetical protein